MFRLSLFRFFVAFLFSFFLLASASSAEQAPEKTALFQLQNAVNKLTHLLTNKELIKEERHRKIEKLFRETFSFDEMAKRVLTRTWKKISEEERKEFSENFGKLILTSYMKQLDEYSDQKVEYIKAKLLKKRYVEIDTEIIGGKDVFSVNYSMKNFAGDWKVYDVTIENISFINNYKSQFKSTLRKKGFKSLLATLKEMVAKNEAKEKNRQDDEKPEEKINASEKVPVQQKAEEG